VYRRNPIKGSNPFSSAASYIDIYLRLVLLSK
jgi:hypothetical protein